MSMVDVVFEDQIRIPADVVDLRTFRRWVHSKEFPQTGRISFIAGQIEVDMSPEEIQSHAKLKLRLQTTLDNFVLENDLGEMLPDGAFLANEAGDVGNEPDMMFCSWESLESGKVRYVSRSKNKERLVEVFGSPDLVVEIVSNTSVNKDTVRLRKAYFAAHIKEYWLIDARGVDLDFQLLTRGKRKYMAVAPDKEGYRRSPLFKRSFLLQRGRNRIGGAKYEVLMR